jgi:hypothetical protein
MSDRRLALGRLGAALVAGLAIAACGSSSHKPRSKPHSGTTPAASTTSSTPTDAVGTGPVRARLTGENHRPVAGRKWTYEVKVTNAAGRPLDGTVDTEFVLGTTVVGHETPPVHSLRNGVLKDSLTFPAAAIGHPVALQTVVHTRLGSVTLDWPVTTVK